MEINRLSLLTAAIWAFFIIFVIIYLLNPSTSILQLCALILSGTLAIMFLTVFIKTDKKLKTKERKKEKLLTIFGGVIMIAGILLLSFDSFDKVENIGWILLILSFIPNILAINRSKSQEQQD